MKNYDYKQWVIHPQAFQSKLSIYIFGICALSIVSFILFAEISKLITVNSIILVFPALCFYLVMVILWSRWVSISMMSSLKVIEKNIEAILTDSELRSQPDAYLITNQTENYWWQTIASEKSLYMISKSCIKSINIELKL